MKSLLTPIEAQKDAFGGRLEKATPKPIRKEIKKRPQYLFSLSYYQHPFLATIERLMDCG